MQLKIYARIETCIRNSCPDRLRSEQAAEGKGGLPHTIIGLLDEFGLCQPHLRLPRRNGKGECVTAYLHEMAVNLTLIGAVP